MEKSIPPSPFCISEEAAEEIVRLAMDANISSGVLEIGITKYNKPKPLKLHGQIPPRLAHRQVFQSPAIPFTIVIRGDFTKLASLELHFITGCVDTGLVEQQRSGFRFHYASAALEERIEKQHLANMVPTGAVQ